IEGRGMRHPFVLLYAAEILLMCSLWLLGPHLAPNGSVAAKDGWPYYVLAGLATLAMGLQNATLQHVHGLGIPTTYVSGILTGFAHACGQVLSGTPGDGLPPSTRIRLYGVLWVVYVLGAILAAIGSARWGFTALWSQ